MEFGLGRVRAALAGLGDPHEAVPVVHVAGTNGKGSVSAMIESIARAAGLSTGLYTSPHLCRFAERIRLDGEPISDERFASALRAVIERCPPDLTFFESFTVAAFVAFREAAVDLAVVEVGLGGRLDATNVVSAPVATAITSIALDHTELLGGSLELIAAEKAGILKRGAPVAIGPLEPEALAVVKRVARDVGAGPVVRCEALPAGAHVGLSGPHQRQNAGVAAAVAHALAARWPAMPPAIGAGLARVAWPGRFERLERDGVMLVLDCAHNPHGAEALVRAVHDAWPQWDPDRATLVFGALADKDYCAMLRLLAPLAARRIYTSPQGRAPASADELARIMPGAHVEPAAEAVRRAIAASREGERVVVAGSMYLIGEVRAALLGIEADPLVAL
jgi:dihydrofolate synthase / folylpolyglutamate synthase